MGWQAKVNPYAGAKTDSSGVYDRILFDPDGHSAHVRAQYDRRRMGMNPEMRRISNVEGIVFNGHGGVISHARETHSEPMRPQGELHAMR